MPSSCFLIWTSCRIISALVGAQIAGSYAEMDARRKYSLIEIAKVVNDCSDEQTRVPDGVLYGVQSRTKIVMGLMLVMLLIMVVKMVAFCGFFSIEVY